MWTQDRGGRGSVRLGVGRREHLGRRKHSLAQGEAAGQRAAGTSWDGGPGHTGAPRPASGCTGPGWPRGGAERRRRRQELLEWLGCPEPSRLLQACMRGWKAGAADADCRLLPAKPSTPRVPTTPGCPRGKATWFTDVSEPTVPGVRGWQQAHRTEECGRGPTDAGGPAAPGLPRGAVQSPLTAGRVLAGALASTRKLILAAYRMAGETS